MQNANRKLANFGKKMQSVGTGLSIGLTAPIVALGVKSVMAFDKQAKAIAQVEAGIESTGGAANRTSQELQDMATSLQGTTLFGDDDILKDVTAQLLTFTNIANEQFDRTQLAALNLATRLDGDLKSASIQLGKALNDPVANLSALSRSGIQFSVEQKNVIKALVETNKLAEAQTIILNELEKQYGGAAEAAANSGTGAFKQLSNILGDITEDFGEIITEAILPFVQKIKSLAEGFKALSPQTKKFIAILAGVAAVIGPLLALAGTILPAIGTGLTLLTGPIGLIAAGLIAVAGIIYKNWEPIKQTLVDIANYFVDLYNESTVFRIAVDAIVLSFKNMWEAAKFVFNAISSILKHQVAAFVNSFKVIGKVIKAALTFDAELMAEGLREFKENATSSIGTLIKDLTKDWKGFSTGLGNNIKDAIEGGGKRAKIVITEDQVDTTAVVNKVANAVAGGASGRAKVVSVQVFKSEGIKSLVSDLNLVGEQYGEMAEKVDIAGVKAKIAAQDMSEQMTTAINNAAVNIAVGFGEMLAAFASGAAGAADIAKLMLGTLGSLLIQLGKIAIQAGVGLLAIELAFKTLGGIGAIAAGIALVAFGTLIKGQIQEAPKKVALATGGVVFGETLAIVGDNRNAAFDPEIVAPLSKLRDFINPSGGNTEISLGLGTTIKGSDLELVIDRVLTRKLRY